MTQQVTVKSDVHDKLRRFVEEYPEIENENEAIWGMVGDWLSSYEWAAPPYDLTSTFERWRGRARNG